MTEIPAHMREQIRDFTSRLRWRAVGREWLADTATMLGLVSILPVGTHEPRRNAARALPLAGAAVGAIGALVLSVALLIGLPTSAAAVLAVAALVLVGGGLHEDGLADTADGFGAGADTEHKLAIMRDSAIGAYGVTGLVLALMARVLLTAGLADAGGAVAAGLALVATGAMSRGAIVAVVSILPPAREEGLGRGFAASASRAAWPASAASLVIAAACTIFTIGFGGLLAALFAVAVATLAVAWLASRQIGGQTGDVCGATQQAAEIAALMGLAVAA